MTKAMLNRPYFPVFGSGAPGGSVPTNAVYYDTSTSPYTPYIYASGAWHSFGAAGGGTNASSLQGVPVSAAAPSPGNVLQYNGTQWAPAAGGGVVPTIVQSAASGGSAVTNSVTLGAAPTQGNLLIAFCPAAANNSPGTGWNIALQNFPFDAFNIFWKKAGASESATQTPMGSSNSFGIVLYELTPFAEIGMYATKFDGNASSVVTNYTTSTNALILGCVQSYNGNNPTSISPGTLDATSGNGSGVKAVQGFHFTPSAAGAQAVTVTYGSGVNKTTGIISILAD